VTNLIPVLSTDVSSTSSQSSGDDASAIRNLLLELATPDLFQRHPFRLLELPVDASTRDLGRRRQTVEQAARNHLLPPPGPSRVLARSMPPDENEVRAAGHILTDAKSRLVYELLWFWPLRVGGHATDASLLALTSDNAGPAIQNWAAMASSGGTAQQVAVAWHNMATYLLFSALEAGSDSTSGAVEEVRGTWDKAWSWWLPLTEDGHELWQCVRERIKDIDDPALKTGAAESLRRGLPTALALLQLRHAVSFWEAGQADLARGLLADLSAVQLPANASGALDDARRAVTDPLRASLKKLGEAAATEARANKRKAADVLDQYLANSLPLLSKIDMLLPSGSAAWVDAHDTTALNGLTCQISYGNETEDWSRCIPMLEKCLSIAKGQAAKGRIQENLVVVRANAESDSLASTCWFCGEHEADASQEVPVPMHGDVKTNYVPGGTQTTWRHLTVKVPRCKDCANVHSREEGGVAAGCSLFVAAVIAAILVGSNVGESAGWMSLFVGAIIAITIGGIIQSRIPKIKGLKRPRNDYPPIAKLRSQGWQDGEKPATS
jgi:hypothetical protein